MNDIELAQAVGDSFVPFEGGVTDLNAATWAYVLREAMLAIDLQYFRPDADLHRLQEGLLSSAAVVHAALSQLLPGNGLYRSTATIVGALATLHNGATHPLLKPRKRPRISRAEWDIIRGGAAASVTALVESGLSKHDAFESVAKTFAAKGIRGRMKNLRSDHGISSEGVKRWFNMASKDGPTIGAGAVKAGLLGASNIIALRPFKQKDATHFVDVIAEQCQQMMLVWSVDPQI